MKDENKLNKNKISIIVPVYNAEKYLEDCLESLLNQTYSNIEILCINDGSTDNSSEILENYAQKDKRIRVFSQTNSGPATARNMGLSNANGEFLMFCDSDDTYETTMCEEMINALRRTDSDFVMCDANIIEADPNHGRNQNVINYHLLKYKGEYLLTAWQKVKINVLLWNKIYKMSLIKKHNISFPNGFECDDSAFNWQYFSYSKKMYGLDKKLYNYKLLENSVMGRIYAQKKLGRVFDRIYAMKYTIDNLIKNNVLNDNKWVLKSIEDGIYWANTFLDDDIVLNYLKKVNKNLLINFSKEDLKEYSLLFLCYKKYYKKILMDFCQNQRKKIHWFGVSKIENKVKFYFFGIPILKIKKDETSKKYYFLGVKVFNKDNRIKQVLSRLQELEDKFSIYYLKQRLFTPINIDEDKRYIICFDCLYDSNQECIDAYTFFKYLQKNNIPSKYVVLKDSKLGQEIENEKDVVTVYDRYHFLFEYAHIIQCSKCIATSFGILSDLNPLLEALPYTDYLFLDHGTMLLKKWVINIYNSKFFNKILVPTKLTKDLYLENNIWDKSQMIFAGLPRWDNLQKTSCQNNKNIFVFFTWRNTFLNNPHLAQKYLNNIILVVNQLKKAVGSDVQINIAWHHELEHNNVDLPDLFDSSIKLIRTDNISEAIKNSDMLITDYSSIWSDFMYQNKPVIFYRFDKDEVYLNDNDQEACIDAMREDDKLYNCYYNLEDVIKKTRYYVDNNFILEPKYKEINNEIFLHKENNCAEIYKQIIQKPGMIDE